MSLQCLAQMSLQAVPQGVSMKQALWSQPRLARRLLTF